MRFCKSDTIGAYCTDILKMPVWHTRELNPNRNVWICVSEQTLKSKPRESTPITPASYERCKEKLINVNTNWNISHTKHKLINPQIKTSKGIYEKITINAILKSSKWDNLGQKNLRNHIHCGRRWYKIIFFQN